MRRYDSDVTSHGSPTRLVDAALQLLEIEDDRFVGAEQVRQDLVAWPRRCRCGGPRVLEKRPQPLADVGWKHSLEILERRAAQRGILRVEAAESDSHRF